ncbi:MAG: sugar ABC transporter substrate-binding protein [Kangiellaceae bacterium]|nr:sugar ABC transporter substrate-binding protein [Kangiellaceae bacterium]|tara:strand:+ start:4001 stop:4624 length:624 start_codon:yes stop_codon:yes gene_type:complete
MRPSALVVFISWLVATLAGCAGQQLPSAKVYQSQTQQADQYQYLIGPGDRLNIFVWRNPEVSGTYIVRPDGRITASLVEDLDVAGKTPATLARDIEKQLGKYLRDPIVTVSVDNFVGPYREQVRIIGEAVAPKAINYRRNMTLLDLVIAAGGLSEFAAGNRAKLIRIENGGQQTYQLRIDDLINGGDMAANVDILPGDVVVIPEAWF